MNKKENRMAVRQTVEKYHGVFSVDTDAEVFAVAITIPVAQK